MSADHACQHSFSVLLRPTLTEPWPACLELMNWAKQQLSGREPGRCVEGGKTESSPKARLLVAKAHERVANARHDFQHKLSRQIVDDNQAVIVETLKVGNMMKNARLAKHIGDASWYALITKLDYKTKEQGKHLVKIAPWFASSKTCHVCQHKRDAMPCR